MFSKIVFWEPSASPHKFQFFERLAHLFVGSVTCLADQDISDQRKRLGWSYREPTGFDLHIDPSQDVMDRFVGMESALHIFSGIRHHRNIEYGIKECVRKNRPFIIMSEPRVAEGVRGWLRFFQSVFAEGSIRKHCLGVLAIGVNGPKWFQSVGYSDQKIKMFGYFVEPPALPSQSLKNGFSSEGGLKIGYLGRLNVEKGFGCVLDAFLSDPTLGELVVAGAGELSSKLESALSEGRVSGRYLNAIGMSEVPAFLDEIDLLVAPSLTTDDGWGVSLCEALMAGKPVVTSSKVGASVLIGDEFWGVVLRSVSSASVSTAIRELAARREFYASTRRERSTEAQRRVSAAAGAAYFLDTVRFFVGELPEVYPPWRVIP